ncbi:TetR/AcrR family tetracycline transcriptional repressor [Kibdelosporangium banguiense]|uniref:TetR/AcrR family tetracycline transcriptional repressor n=1 Tax=Kibdelosporangium banguiense TaxID=1365924 RepID=A0ABS4TCB6_9PSEU|nr:TetR/AcrR family transcriptional regulator C-terminal domain-containing protein [Kibdelosporangium banguiense]MBP2321503.1 TetR/AcrR family tetracycline transcriptional repressor [Kibdelosporangium banguiense]
MTRVVKLTRQGLIEAGLRLLDEVGLDGLTVRRLAAEFDVKSPALYWHFRTKQELLDGMADAIVTAPGMGPPRQGESWQDWLLRRARAYRDSLLAHRDGARIVVQSTTRSPETLKALDSELAAMVNLGFTPAQALRTIGAITVYVNGFVLQEQTGVSGAPPDLTSTPTLAEALQARGTHTDLFNYGLRALIGGVIPDVN